MVYYLGMSRKISANIYLNEFSDDHQLDPQDRQLLILARKSLNQAYAPYSGFKVGCAVLLEDDLIITGSNQENASYPSGLCAERVALFAASSHHPQKTIYKLAISAQKASGSQYLPVTPCGGCRQVMIEYQSKQGQPIEILMEGENGKVYHAESVDMLLPFKFSEENLK